jgi:hypothetical protein
MEIKLCSLRGNVGLHELRSCGPFNEKSVPRIWLLSTILINRWGVGVVVAAVAVAVAAAAAVVVVLNQSL